MTITRCVRIVLTLAALALAGRLAAGEPPVVFSGLKSEAKTESALPSDLALIPGDAAGFISIHPAALFDKVVNKDARKIRDLAKSFEEASGLKATDIERVTIALIGEDKPLAVVRTVQPYDKAALLETLVPGAKKQEIEGKTCYKSADKDRLVCFVDERVFFIGDKADETAFAHYLKGATTKPDFSSMLTQTLSETPQHLAIGCIDLRLLGTLGENSPFDKLGSAQLVGDAEWAVVRCDYDGEIKVEARITYPTEESAWQGTKVVRIGVDNVRGLCLELTVAADMAQGDDVKSKELRRFKSALQLVRQLEKSLQGVEAKPVKCEGGFELAVKFGVKASKDALTRAIGDALDDKMLGIGTTVSGASLPSGAYLEHPPQSVPRESLEGAPVGKPSRTTEGQPLRAPTATTPDSEVEQMPKIVVDHTAANFRAVPRNAAAFLTIRVADLFDQMCDKDLDAFQKFDDEFQKNTGLRHADVELFTVVVLPPHKDEKSGPTACIVTLKNACDKDSLFKPLQDNPLKKIKIGGKECCQNDAENRLFYFIDERTFLWGGSDQEAFAACLKALDDDSNTKTPLSLALAKSKDCHVFGWCDVSKFDIANKSVDMPFIKILAETQTATLTMHYDGELKTNVTLLFEDEESAKTGARAMMSGVKLLRSEVAIMTNMADIAKEGGDVAGPELKQFVGLIGFMEKLETALQTVEAKTAKDADGCWSTSVVCNVKVGRKALTKAMTAVPDMENEMFKLKAPEKGAVLEPLPPLSPSFGESSAPSTAPVRPVELNLTLPSPTEKSAVKLTVANTTKTKALLYQQGEDNKLTFCKEIPVGEAIDVPAKAGQRWIVLFPDKKDGGETFVLGSSDGTWLLRPTVEPAATAPQQSHRGGTTDGPDKRTANYDPPPVTYSPPPGLDPRFSEHQSYPKGLVFSDSVRRTHYTAVPKNAAAFLTIRVADLFDKMCDKELDAFKKFDDEFQKNTGLRHADIRLLTIITLPGKDGKQGGPTVSVVALNQPCDKDKLFAPLQKTPLHKIKLAGKECYQSDDKDRLFYFIDDCTFVWGRKDEAAFAACLKALDDKPDNQSPLGRALEQSVDSQVFGWCNVPIYEARTLDDRSFEKLLRQMQTATISLRYDDKLKIQLRLQFPDQKSAEDGAKWLTFAVRLIQMACQEQVCQAGLSEEGFVERTDDEKLPASWVALMALGDRGLQTMEVRTTKREGGTWLVSADCKVKADRQTITRALGGRPDLENDWFDLKPPAKSTSEFDWPLPDGWSSRETPAAKLTVANTTNMKALLYRKGDDDKLTFCKEVPVGKAIEVPSQRLERWVVQFEGKKDGEKTFVVDSSDATWLLR